MTKEEEKSTVVINGKVLGNTEYMAQIIKENTGADIFRIEPEKPYTKNHTELVALATEERKNNVRPEMLQKVENIQQYDTIFVGYPIWWGDMPMILYSFFDSEDLSGKEIIPFGTNGGSGFAGTVESIMELEPRATASKSGLTISRDNIQNSESEIVGWLKKLGYKK